ncbi:hydroxymethylglutaryl-CoA reductase, degradative [Sphingobacteriales bacterium UPWRP_1]|nr:hydroxymethylglutaryl-CoA reductase, degradative [Sphingobacteriales bacterium UPWRP_1]
MRTKDKMIDGFSKFSKREKIAWMVRHFFTSNPIDVAREFASFWHSNVEAQKLFDGISENTVTNFYMPYGVAPNFLINDRLYCVPMVIEESSVVAAASSGAKFWSERGGFKAKVIATTKVGHVHFLWPGEPAKLFRFFETVKPRLLQGVSHITCNMESRGGGVTGLELLYLPEIEEGYYQLKTNFETCDAMGANFINSVLETFAHLLIEEAQNYPDFELHEQQVQIIMAILSNYTPECLVRSSVECHIAELGNFGKMHATEFAEKFVRAVNIARNDTYRAATHNKGIYNGIDAVVIATGNDFRAIEACGHAYAARNGKYISLSEAGIRDGKLWFQLEVPLAVGTIGGLTKIHPLAKLSLELLGNPTSEELMQIIASVGLAQNFAAVRSLVTTGIQKGHMKMHFNNILSHFNANEHERQQAEIYFADKTVSFASVRTFIESLRQNITIS